MSINKRYRYTCCRRSILFPREHEESFISDSLRFIVVMLAGCMGLYIWAAVVLHSIGSSPDRIVVGSVAGKRWLRVVGWGLAQVSPQHV